MTDPKTLKMLDKLARAIECLADADGGEAHVEAVELARDVMLLAAAEKPADVVASDGAAERLQSAIAERARLRGRPLTAQEKLDNLKRAMDYAEKPAEAAPVAPALPWVVRRRDDKTVVATFLNVVYAGDYHRVILGDSDTFEVVPAAAPTVAAVGFNEFGVARGDGWTADYDHSDATRTLRVYIGLRPGEDAGETLAKALAAVGRTA